MIFFMTEKKYYEISEEIRKELVETIRDPLWKNINVPSAVKELMQVEEVQRLHRIKQLGPSYLVYPGATHTRLTHSLGVFYVAYRMIESILRTPVNAPNLPYMEKSDVMAFLLASFLHDIGHFPYTHSLKDLIIDGRPLKEHETLSAELIKSEAISGILKKNNINPDFVAAIIDKDLNPTSKDINQDCLVLFRALLSGVLDPDKMDYLTRDAFFCGLPYGTQDIDFVLTCLRAVKKDNGFYPAISDNGIGAIEHILFGKYLMYRSVYWHRRVRSATAMIKKAVMLMLEESDSVRPEDLYYKDDDTFINLFGIKGVPEEAKALVYRVKHNRLFYIAYELPFNKERHTKLEDFTNRKDMEKRLSIETNIPDVIIDIPEDVSFDESIYVVSDKGNNIMDFMDARTVFSKDNIQSFTGKLRYIRVITPCNVNDDKSLFKRIEDVFTKI